MYFDELKKLLFEPNFLAWISGLYKDFLFVDCFSFYYELEQKGDFIIPLNRWLANKETDNDVKKVRYLATIEMEKKINSVWNDFNEKIVQKQSNQELSIFGKEATELKELILKLEYFKFSKRNIELLERIEKYTLEMGVSKNPIKDNTTTSIEPIIWNAGVSVLGTLFQELTTLKVPKSTKTCISTDYPTILKFIVENFVDENGEPFPESSVKTYLYPNQKKAADKNKLKIGF